MTVVPDAELMTLVCDHCGASVTTSARALPDAEVVWTLVLDQGWTGSAFATGPHHCPRCDWLDGQDGPTGGGRSGRRATPAGTRRSGSGGANGNGAGSTPAGHERSGRNDLHRALAAAQTVGRYVVVDLATVRTIDPDDLSLLVRARQDARSRGDVLCLAAPSRFVRCALHTMRLDAAFPIFDSRVQALRTLPAARTDADTAGVPVPQHEEAHVPAEPTGHGPATDS
ncbi:STAS domain-containing protein [Plantactinospora sp. KBS50]|uniref:STAS domain-containing protein n=1 Tax=Plantactinospora sp. KBS50 TaxID=2024580 RepID=UPI001E562A72|nr:STAS domain-containing protein [Plantactinospora sp. KBS50]